MSAKDAVQQAIVIHESRLAGLGAPAAEHRFHPIRKWRFDWAWVPQKIALEVQGGVWTGGKHGRGAGIVKDHEKLNAAQALGWRVIQLTPGQVKKGELLAWLKEMHKEAAA